MVRFISHTERYGDAIAELPRLSVIAMYLPVSTESCELSFSVKKRVTKSRWVRNSISNEKLDRVFIVAIELCQFLDTGTILDAFAASLKIRRYALT